MGLIRLDKFLADNSVGTRTEVKKYIKNGRITIDGVVVKDSALKIDTDKAEVFFDGIKLSYEEYHYYILNKPAGCVSATKDRLSETVLSFFKDELTTKELGKLFPVGRLDKDTEGLLLITDDGKLAHELLSPKKHVDKVYHALTDKKLTDYEMNKFETGLDIGDEKLTLPASISYIDSDAEIAKSYFDKERLDDRFLYEVKIHEGRFHQIKRMFKVFDAEVVYLRRISMGNLTIDNALKTGEYRKLTLEEISNI